MANDNSLYTLLETSFRAAGDGAAFVVPGGRTVTYKALSDDVGRMANALVKLGIKPGDRVMVQVEKSIENVVLYLATLKIGAVYNPLNTAYMPAELEYFIGDAEPTVIVVPKAQSRRSRKLRPPTRCPPSRAWRPMAPAPSSILPASSRHRT